MELPDDVLSLIREYSRPLKQRTISNYWVGQGLEFIDEMANIVFEEFISWGLPNAIMCRYGNTWTIFGNIDLHVTTFNEKELLK